MKVNGKPLADEEIRISSTALNATLHSDYTRVARELLRACRGFDEVIARMKVRDLAQIGWDTPPTKDPNE